MRMVFLFLLFPFLSPAQPAPPALRVGDAVPDVLLQGLQQYPSSSARLSSLAPLLILDFWATWCSSCLARLPLMDSLQQQFNGRLQFLLVNARSTGDDLSRIQSSFRRRPLPSGQPHRLPYLAGDTLLSGFFPHTAVPHYVWIRNGVVQAITGSEEVDTAHIAGLLRGQSPDMHTKIDLMKMDPARPLLQNLEGQPHPAPIYQGLLLPYVDGLFSTSGSHRDSATGTLRLFSYNRPLLSLYEEALGTPLQNRLVLEVGNPDRYRPPARQYAHWIRQNGYCYEIIGPASEGIPALRRRMLEDLNRLLGLHGRWEERKTTCLVLRERPKGSGENAAHPAYTGRPLFFCGQPLSRFVQLLNRQERQPSLLVVDETGRKGPVNLELKASPQDLPAISRELARYGLELSPAERVVPVFVLTEIAKDRPAAGH